MPTERLPPAPVPDDISRPFWEGVRQGELRIQRCQGCGRWSHPPEPFCLGCGSTDLGFETVSGDGTVHSFVVMRDQRVRGYEHRVPYVNVWVALDEDPSLIMLANLAGEVDEVAIGRRVRVGFETIGEDLVLPTFSLAP